MKSESYHVTSFGCTFITAVAQVAVTGQSNTLLLLLIFLCSGRRKSTIASGSNANFRSEGLAGEILDPLLLLHVLFHQFLWKGIYSLFPSSGETFMGIKSPMCDHG